MTIVNDFMKYNTDPNTPVTISRTYEELKKEINLDVGDAGVSEQEILTAIESVLKYSTRTGKSLFLDKLYAGSESVGQVAEFILAIINSNCHVYPSSPVVCSMEHYLIAKVGRMLGYLKPDGIFCPGGSYANLMSLMCAREKYFPHVRKTGWQIGDNPVIMTSAHDHYSCATAVQTCGIGLDRQWKVPCEKGQMIPEALEESIENARNKGFNPFYVNAMNGTTVLCAYDNLEAISAVCQRQNLWLHVDGCIGGSMMFSRKYPGLLAGTRYTDSYTWNAHKLMGVPLQCTMLVTKDKGYLNQACATGAEYLYHDSNPLNHGERTLQCGRKGDAFKLWLFWKKYGRKGMEERVNRAMDLTQEMAEKIRAREEFQLVLDPQGTNVCFWYVPKKYRGTVVSPLVDPENAHVPQELSDIAKKTKPVMIQRGNVMVDIAPLTQENMNHFFRMTVVTPKLTGADLDYVLQEIADVAQTMETD